MSEEKLYAEVCKQRRVSEKEWEYLRLKGYVDEALVRGDETALRDLVDEIDLLPHRSGSGRKHGETDERGEGNGNFFRYISEPFSVELSDVEAERAKVLLEIQTREASAHPYVQEFRKHYLNDKLLSPEEAEECLSSPGSGQLEQLGSQLVQHYGWHKHDATWWVLTGEAPPLRPVRVAYRWTKSVYGPDVYSIELEAAPWVSAETVTRAFQEMQWRVVPRRRGRRGTNKPLDQRTLRVLRFVEEQKGSLQAAPPTYQVLLERWNQQHPEEVYPDYRTFRRAYKRAFHNVIRPPYNTEPPREPTPNMERQRKRRNKRLERLEALAERIGPAAIPVNLSRLRRKS